MKRDINIELMKAKAEEANRKYEFNLKMNELKKLSYQIDLKLGGIKL